MSVKNLGSLVLLLVMAVSPLNAAIYTVNSGDVADLNQAITDANNNPGADVVQISAAGTYAGDIVWPVESITIEATVPGVIIEKTAGAGQVIRCDPGGAGTSGRTDQFIIRGAGEAAKMTLKNSVSVAPVVNTGPDFDTDLQQVILENVVLEQDTSLAGTMLVFNNINNATPHRLINVDFVGGQNEAGGNTTSVAVLGADAYLDGCDFSGAQSNGARLVSYLESTVVVESSTLHPSAANGAFSYICQDASEITFNDCSFLTNGWYYAFQFISTPATGPGTITLVRPTFAGNCGAIMFACGQDCQGILNVVGEVDNKVDFTPPMNNGAIVAARFTDGEINFTNCTGESSTVTNLVDCAAQGVLTGPLTINMDGCIWKGNAGTCGLVDQYDAGAPELTAYPVTLNATNTLWLGDGQNTVGYHINLNDDYWNGTGADPTRSATSTLNFVHCTMDGDVASGAFQWSIWTPSTGLTVINSYYSIFDGSTSFEDAPGIVTNVTPLQGNGNICYGNGELPGIDGALAFLAGEPADTLKLAPMMDAEGMLTMSSPAIGRAVGSWLEVDVIGQTRPMPEGETWGDIGAYEEQTVTLEVPAPSASVGSWEIYE